MLKQSSSSLEAFPVDDGRAGLVVLLLGDPHLLEGAQRGKDGATDPDGVLALRWCDDLDLHGRRGEGGDLLLHAVSDAWVHGGTARQDGVGVQVLTDINVALHDGVVGGLVDAAGFHTQERGLEESLWATEALVSDGDDLTVGKLVALLERAAAGSGGHLLFEVQSDIAELLLDVTNDFTLGGGGEAVATLSEDLHQVVGQVTTSQIQTKDGMRQGITFVDGYGVGDTITGVKHDTGGTTGSVQGEHGLNGDVHRWGVECLKHDLSHLLTIGLGIERGFGEQNGVLLGGNTQLIVEGVMPDLLHIVPVGDNAVLDRVFQGEDTTFGLGLITYVRVLLTHTDHHTLMTRAAHDRGEDGTRRVITGETGFAHTGSIVNDECGNFFVTHFVRLLQVKKKIQVSFQCMASGCRQIATCLR